MITSNQFRFKKYSTDILLVLSSDLSTHTKLPDSFCLEISIRICSRSLFLMDLSGILQETFACLKSIIDTLEKEVRYVEG